TITYVICYNNFLVVRLTFPVEVVRILGNSLERSTGKVEIIAFCCLNAYFANKPLKKHTT
ncbi:hypothetical protein, partial [Alteromonas sp. 14N.309.X.WAT.G.H12]|uniref:hypothetical protein n=1 Tax=Alteromonas sp. 14N.309.X.WAT.G.H12 TaxID=3120824 RepID=UPI002FD6580A